MKKSHRKRTRNHETLSATDFADYLRDLARAYQGEKTGNPALGDALMHLSEEFRPHGKRPISELTITDRFVWLPDIHPITAGNGKPTSRRRRDPNGSSRPVATSRKNKSTLPDDLESLSRGDVEKILEEDRLTKQQIAELGHARFGISKSSLLRARKDRAINSILSALRNERTMHIIAEQSREAGRTRSA